MSIFCLIERLAIVIVLINIHLFSAEDKSSNFVVVNTQYGPVKGVEKLSILGDNFQSFQGIPYMKAPIGKLRFRNAQPPENWTEPLDATNDPPAYHNYDFYKRSVEGQEDAAVINVYTRNSNPEKLQPVMVFIHGGGFIGFSGGPSQCGPDYFMSREIVLVTFNYRLGVKGFLSLSDPDLDVPGNAGLKDQVFALKWVQQNIANFGGDPKAVTAFGQSAGAASVHLHMMSEQSRGLFQRAIIMSGVTFDRWMFAPDLNWNEKLAKKLEYNFANESEFLEFLETVDPTRLVEESLQDSKEMNARYILYPFGPKVEPYSNEKTFLKEIHVKALRSAWGNDIDCMVGFISFDSVLSADFDNSPEVEEFIGYHKKNPAFFLPLNELKLDENSEKAKELGKMLKETYFGKLNPTRTSMEPFHFFKTDLWTIHGATRAVKSRLKYGSGQNFLYRFDLDTSLNFVKRNLVKKENAPGAAHGDDIFYLFSTEYVKPPSKNSTEFQLIMKMVDFWTSFAISGKPSSENSGTWNPVSKTEENQALDCYEIGNDEQKMIPMPEYERMQVWDEVYEKAGIDLI